MRHHLFTSNTHEGAIMYNQRGVIKGRKKVKSTYGAMRSKGITNRLLYMQEDLPKEIIQKIDLKEFIDLKTNFT